MSIEGNLFDKYESKNFLIKRIVRNFIEKIIGYCKKINPESLLDVGTGEGYILNEIYNKLSNLKLIIGTDIGKNVIRKAKFRFKEIDFVISSIYSLPFESDFFELVMALEVLEHLENPESALNELKRVTSKWILLSVPNEPIWRIANIMRGAYLKNFGNTPGHINHWTKRTFKKLISKFFNIEAISQPFPWIIILCKK